MIQMKANVDLTENRDFRKESRGSILRSSFFNQNLIRFPWSVVPYIGNMDFPELLLTGNYSQRKEKMLETDPTETCYRCGKKLIRYPWGVYGLCKPCGQDLEQDVYHEKTEVFLK